MGLVQLCLNISSKCFNFSLIVSKIRKLIEIELCYNDQVEVFFMVLYLKFSFYFSKDHQFLKLSSIFFSLSVCNAFLANFLNY